MAMDNEELNKRRQKREELRLQRIAQQRKLILGLICGGIVLILCGILIFLVTRKAPETQVEKPAETQAQQEDTQPPETTTPVRETVIRLAAAGDLNVTDKSVAAGLNGTTYDYTNVFMDVVPLLSDADLTVMNFEGILCGAPYGGEDGSAPQELMTALRNAGVDLLQTANSCSINGGLLGLAETLTNIRSAGMVPIGTFADSKEFRETGGYTVMEVEGVKIAFVAFTKGMDNRGLPTGSEDCVNLLYTDYATTYQKVDTDGINEILRAVEKEAPDLTVALLHWGSEYNDQISSSQKTIRNLMLSGGVDVILGSHPHYVQEMVLDEENDTFVAYSLGDFFGDAERAGSNYSVILNLEITKNQDTGVTRITDYTWHPIFTQTTETGLEVVRIHDAINAYQSDFILKCSESDYNSMEHALGRIDARVKGE